MYYCKIEGQLIEGESWPSFNNEINNFIGRLENPPLKVDWWDDNGNSGGICLDPDCQCEGSWTN